MIVGVTYWVKHPDQPDRFYDPTLSRRDSWWPLGGVHEYGCTIEADSVEQVREMMAGLPVRVEGEVFIVPVDELDGLDDEGEEWKRGHDPLK